MIQNIFLGSAYSYFVTWIRYSYLISGKRQMSYSNRDTLWNAWNRHLGSLKVDRDLIKEVSLSRILMVFWSSTSYSDSMTWIRLYTILMTLIPNLTLPNYERFSWSICHCYGLPAATTDPSKNLLLGICILVYMLYLLRQFLPKLLQVFRFFSIQIYLGITLILLKTSTFREWNGFIMYSLTVWLQIGA